MGVGLAQSLCFETEPGDKRSRYCLNASAGAGAGSARIDFSQTEFVYLASYPAC